MTSSVLMVVADCPGYFVETTYRMAERLRSEGVQPVFAVTSPFYERFKGYSLQDLGPVYYLSDYLATHQDDHRVPEVELDYWLSHATFVRTRYFYGRHINDWDDYRRTFLFFRDLFDRHNDVRAVWSEMPSSAVIRIAQTEASSRDIPFLGYISARVPAHFNVVSDSLGSQLLTNPEAPTSVSTDEPDYMKIPMANLAHTSISTLLSGTARKLWQAMNSYDEKSIEMGNPLRLQISWYRRQIRRKLYYKYAVSRSIFSSLPEANDENRSVVFPLHYRPEASTSVQARYFENDIETIRNIAFSLPHRTHLYVKEHPSAIGLHSRAFYREISSFPNVRILDIYPPLSAVIDQFDCVVTLTSTAGFEALQHGVPVLLLGSTFYEDYPGVTRMSSWEHLTDALQSIVKRDPATTPFDTTMRRYLEHCFAGTFGYTHPAVVEPDNIDLLLEPIWQVIGRGARD